MRVRVAYTTDVPVDFRHAVACYDGDHGDKASRERLKSLFEYVGKTLDDDIMQEWLDCDICHPDWTQDDIDAQAAGNFV